MTISTIAGRALGYPNKDSSAISLDIQKQIRNFEQSLPSDMYVAVIRDGLQIIIDTIEFTLSDLLILSGHCIPSLTPARIVCHTYSVNLQLVGLEYQGEEPYHDKKPIGFVLPSD